MMPSVKVRVKDWYPPGHVRVPAYLRGKTGEIERELGLFHNPETNAYRQTGEKRNLLRVRFEMGELWGDEAESPSDILEAEIYEHWLEPADAP
nr:SH3-like domain-containing protein [Amylibacter sp.]